jgi:carboxylate-amine ligase
VLAPSDSPWARAYAAGEAYDEAFTAQGLARPLYGPLLSEIGDRSPRELAERSRALSDAGGITFGAGEGASFAIDPLPRLLAMDEWAPLAQALGQRVRALDAFVGDVYGARRIFAAGVVPERLLDGCAFEEPDLRGHAQRPWVAVAGLDLVRTPAGELRVLEDNVRTPSGLAYALAAHEVVSETLGVADRAADAEAHVRRRLGDVLAAGPAGARVLLSDGPANSAWYEHRRLARLAGVALVGPGDLRRRGEQLQLRATGEAVGVVYRRTDEDRLRAPDGRPTALGELLLAPARAGRVLLVNGFGAGVADDKRVCPHVEQMVRFYLDETPALRSVATFDLLDDEQRAEVLERLGELVVKPRDGHGGRGVLIGPRASARELGRAREEILRAPGDWIAQEVVLLSTAPTIVEGDVVPRHVDLRAFVFFDGVEATAVPGGLTRVAFHEGSLVVNSSRDGGAKDTWVLG